MLNLSPSAEGQGLISTMEEPSPETIVESREELMISPTGEGNPTLRTAHFLKPCEEPVYGIPLHTLSSIPPTFERKDWPFNVIFESWKRPPKEWEEWVDRMESVHGFTWKKAGIHEAVLNSRYEIKRDLGLVFGLAERWCPETNTFIFPWGEATMTLEDMMVFGYSVLGSPVASPVETEELKVVEEKLVTARKELNKTTAKKASYHSWTRKFMDSGSEIEHEAFLALWLSRYMFPKTYGSIWKSVFPISIHLARGTKIALAPAVLATIYRDLSLLKVKMIDSAILGSKQDRDDVLALTLWSPLQLAQIWVWERLVALRPKPNLTVSGKPRLARWNKLIHKAENVKLVLDSEKECFDWRPYAKTVNNNWGLPKFYGDKEMWAEVDGDADEEMLSFARCLRVSTLAGFDCMEQYNPHRVALQFGYDQDLPGCADKSNNSEVIAWTDYCRPIGDKKLYIPSRHFEADFTNRYREWWKRSMSGLQRAREDIVQQQKMCAGFRITPKILKEKKKQNKMKKGDRFSTSFVSESKTSKQEQSKVSLRGLRIAPRRLKRIKGSVRISSFGLSRKTLKGARQSDCLISSFKLTPKNSKRSKEGYAASVNSDFPDEVPKTSAETRKGGKEGNNAFTSTVFSGKGLEESVGNFTRKKKTATLSHVCALKNLENSARKNDTLRECTSRKSPTGLKRKSEEHDKLAGPAFRSRATKTLSLDYIMKRDINSSPFPPGLRAKFIKVEASGICEDDNPTIAQFAADNGAVEVVELVTSAEQVMVAAVGTSLNTGKGQEVPLESSSDGRQNHSSLVVDSGAGEVVKPVTSVEEVIVAIDSRQSTENEGEVAPENSSDQMLNHFCSVADYGVNEVVKAVTSVAMVTAAIKTRQADSGEETSVENSSGEMRNHPSSFAYNGTIEVVKPVTSIEQVMVGVETSLGADCRKKMAFENLSGKMQSQSCAVADNGAINVAKPETSVPQIIAVVETRRGTDSGGEAARENSSGSMQKHSSSDPNDGAIDVAKPFTAVEQVMAAVETGQCAESGGEPAFEKSSGQMQRSSSAADDREPEVRRQEESAEQTTAAADTWLSAEDGGVMIPESSSGKTRNHSSVADNVTVDMHQAVDCESSGHAAFYSSSAAANAALRTPPVRTSVGQVIIMEPQPAVEDRNQSYAPGFGESSTFTVEIPGLLLERRIERLENMLAEWHARSSA